MDAELIERAKALGIPVTRKGGTLISIEELPDGLVVKYQMPGAVREVEIQAKVGFQRQSIEEDFWPAQDFINDCGLDIVIEDDQKSISFKLLDGNKTVLITDDLEMAAAFAMDHHNEKEGFW